jgi:L-ornithine N5-monooxygenase
MTKEIYDIIGIGFGPSNLALAICLEEMGSPLSMCFIDANAEPGWQREMLLSGTDIQNNPLRDLATPRNPKSHYGFLNYLKQVDRLFEYLNLPFHYPLRVEYAHYIKWAAGHFSHCVNSGLEPMISKSGKLIAMMVPAHSDIVW